MKNLRVFVMPALIGLLIGSIGCQAGPAPPPQKIAALPPAAPPPAPPPVSPEVALQERVTRFWEARIKDDVARQYDFLEPEAKERVLLTAFVRTHGTFHFRAYQVRSVNIVEEKGWVKVKYSYSIRVPQLAGFGPWTQEAFEVWVLRDGVWYRPYSQKEAATPPPGISGIAPLRFFLTSREATGIRT
jgi:hypothetical protein